MAQTFKNQAICLGFERLDHLKNRNKKSRVFRILYVQFFDPLYALIISSEKSDQKAKYNVSIGSCEPTLINDLI